MAGMVLREVVTRFKFETDEAGAKKVDRRVNNMKRGIKGLGTLLGVGLGVAGVRAMGRLALTAERAEFVLQNLAGTEFRPLRQNMDRIRQDLSGLRKGAGAIFSDREFDQAAADFIRVFGTGRRELELFDQIFRSAAKQSAVTGDNVVGLVDSLTGAIKSGDFSALLELPGIDQAFIKRLEDINELFNLGEIGGQSAIRQRSEALSRALARVSEQQDKSLRNVPNLLLESDKAAKTLQNSIEQLSKRLAELLVPVLEKLNILLDKFVDTSKEVEKKGLLGTLGSRFVDQGLDTLGIPKNQRGGAVSRSNTNSVTISNTFNIDGSKSAQEIAQEIDRVQRETFRNARENIVPTEDR